MAAAATARASAARAKKKPTATGGLGRHAVTLFVIRSILGDALERVGAGDSVSMSSAGGNRKKLRAARQSLTYCFVPLPRSLPFLITAAACTNHCRRASNSRRA
ncbi:protein of unknown function (plasmid) [Cupriavidus taiwanensis]|nr:hypothetical protein CBM2597_U20018 [Cupriavidus taiwanensis]SOZ96720.1 hypothetical protein CBM2598_U20020 [Cupriavidus taiwanensis]SPD37886.1 protein of unknown function [Cupriavidus taiwanensis]